MTYVDYSGILTGIVSSLAASLLFLAFLFNLRPDVKISSEIARSTMDGKKCYIIKVINRTWGRIYDLHAQLVHITLENVNGGQNVVAKKLTLLKDHIWSANRIKNLKNDPNAEFAVLFVCIDDLDEIWVNNTMIEFRIMSKHGFSGFSRIHKKRYFLLKSTIKDGSFTFGNSFRID